jgi:pyrroline-5-carboxylate reductase
MRASVATKGGVTETIVSALDKGGFRRSLKKSLVAGAKRIGKIRK